MTQDESAERWQKPADEDPYMQVPGSVEAPTGQVLRLNSRELNILSTSLSEIAPPWERQILNYVHYSIKTETPGVHEISWTVQCEHACDYEMRVVLLAPDGDVTVCSGGTELRSEKLGQEHERCFLGVLPLRAGRSRLVARVFVQSAAEVCSLELVEAQVSQRISEEASSLRHQPEWFKDAGYGLMFQWVNRTSPKYGDKVKDWEQKVKDFDVDAFADQVLEMGARYVLWSVTWGQQYISAPIKALDALLPGRTTRRDLLGEIADKLAERSIRLLFYYHFGYDCYHSIDREWMEAAGGYKADKTELYANLQKIIAELGERYGQRLQGWYFDGGRRYYDAHWDSSPAEGPLSAPFRELAAAARKGNAKRMLTFNSWLWPSETPYADYTWCEWYREYEPTEEGVISGGPLKGLQAHAAFPLESHWGHLEFNTPISAPAFNGIQLATMVRKAKTKRYPLSINLEMYEDGSLSPLSVENLKTMKIELQKTLPS
ncbi:MAG: hypothetical protein HQL31_14100 [Planctomycetes bacterium]|nr:hypothetical protein [Planctomycetota bacterium]